LSVIVDDGPTRFYLRLAPAFSKLEPFLLPEFFDAVRSWLPQQNDHILTQIRDIERALPSRLLSYSNTNTPDFETAAGVTFKGVEVARVFVGKTLAEL
jgi:hypothetical protein